MEDDLTKRLNYYQILEIKSTSSQREIKDSYIRLAKIYHPDVYKGSDKNRFRFIKEAYEVLRKPATRRDYDNTLNQFTSQDDPDKQKSENNNYEQKFNEEQQENKTKKNFSFDEKTQQDINKMNLEEEYYKFIKKPIEHPPESVIAFDDPFARQLGFEERVRHEYTFIRNNTDIYNLKFAHQQGYQETLNDTINMMNEKAKSDEVLQYQQNKQQKWINRLKYATIISLFLVSIPIFNTTVKRQRDIRKQLDKESQQFLKIDDESQLNELYSRIEFEHRK